MRHLLYDNIIFSLQKSGGISVLWIEMLRRLVLDDRFALRTIEYAGAIDNLFRKELNLEPTCVESSRFLAMARYLNRNSHSNEPHIFHSSYYRTDRNSKAINITTVHDFTYEHYVGGLSKMIHSQQKFSAIRRSEKIVAISNHTKSDLLHLVSGVDEGRVEVIYNGVSDDFFTIEGEIRTIDLPFGQGEYVVFVGARGGYKNFEAAVRATKLAGCALVAVGGGALNDKERSMTEELLGAKFCHLVGISNTTLNELYNHALALVYPSLYEGFGIPVVEAQKAGCPVVAAYRSSIPEVIGATQVVVDDPTPEAIAEWIAKLSYNSSFRAHEVEQGLVNSRRFTWDQTYDQLTKLYLSL